MKKLERLEKELLDVEKAYNVFMKNNTRKLTDEEKEERKKNRENNPTYVTLQSSEDSFFELTTSNMDEFRILNKNMRNIHSNYRKEYTRHTFYRLENIE